MKGQFVEWDDRYAVGVATIDGQHMELFRFTNDLYDACQQNDAGVTKQFKETLQKAVRYVAEHFRTEEQIMQQTKMPELEAHKSEHDLFVRKVMKEAANLDGGGGDAPELFVRFLKDWISSHVTATDVKIGEHIARQKAEGLIAADIVF